MPKWLLRSIALLLIPALTADPVFAHSYPARSVEDLRVRAEDNLFSQQALAVRLTEFI